MNTCTTIYTSDEANCLSQQQSCLTSQLNLCKYSTCPGYCGPNNAVQLNGVTYNDTTVSCNCSCLCNPGSRPGCSGAICVSGNWSCSSPIAIDVAKNGFDLTGVAGGVRFDLLGNGMPKRIGWTKAGSDDGWLALDRDGNGWIDDGTELFGNSTLQPESPDQNLANGFLALALFDRPENGGNANGLIDPEDLVFARLRVWQDLNHNGISEPLELISLSDADIGQIDLQYQVSRRTDRHGNAFYYRARLWDSAGHLRRWAWDVFLVGCATP